MALAPAMEYQVGFYCVELVGLANNLTKPRQASKMFLFNVKDISPGMINPGCIFYANLDLHQGHGRAADFPR